MSGPAETVGLVGFLLNATAGMSVALLTQPNADERRRIRDRFFVFFERAPAGRTAGRRKSARSFF